ncbi:MAG: RHS repeat-associated core domain-containing protein, partial [Thioalkalivibrio sp.]|nr:RHS repeat-associated core domain-containing protein [Thioalkalivibrio sp.]
QHYWYGSLSVGMRDASGQMYMRNRYYNPQTGQFTQPDPIGLAGGMNAYGFAAGDPVSYSDPFGLCPMCIAAVAVIEVASAVYDVYETYKAFRDGGAHQGGEALQATLIGAIAPGPGNAYRNGGNALQAGVQANRVAGAAGESFLRQTFGGGAASVPTSQGWRHIDNLTGGIAQESKVGNVTMSPRIRSEILKDAELLRDPNSGVTRAEWHFFPNANGQSNVSNSVLELLHTNGIVPSFWASKP